MQQLTRDNRKTNVGGGVIVDVLKGVGMGRVNVYYTIFFPSLQYSAGTRPNATHLQHA